MGVSFASPYPDTHFLPPAPAAWVAWCYCQGHQTPHSRATHEREPLGSMEGTISLILKMQSPPGEAQSVLWPLFEGTEPRPANQGGLGSLLPGAGADGLLWRLLLRAEPSLLWCSSCCLHFFFVGFPESPLLPCYSSPRKGVGFPNFPWCINANQMWFQATLTDLVG